ncbi:MAG: hypothetical protein WKG01_15640 [Kofleriaceae bacterium]
MRILVVVAMTLVGCYDPIAPANAPCPDGECPTGQRCVAGSCRLEAETDAPIVDGARGSDAPAGSCMGGDGECLVACVDVDPDCVTTCGDSRCVGSAGELCGACAADCATRTAVCGNGACDPGEAPDCYADCGPAPWLWASEEQDVIARVNAKRVGGVRCPGSDKQVTAPALVAEPSLVPATHEWAWEIAHQNVLVSGGGACNGRTNADRQVPVDFDAYVQSRGYATVAIAVEAWFASMTICPSLVSTTRTKIAAGVAFDVAKGYVVVLE